MRCESARLRLSSVPDADFFGQPRFCSRCGQPVIVEGASFCKECGNALEAAGAKRNFNPRPLIAFVLSIVPGLGHIYQGHIGRGIAWFFGVAIAHGMGPIGYVLHLICAFNAASYGSNRGDEWFRRRHRRRTDRLSAHL